MRLTLTFVILFASCVTRTNAQIFTSNLPIVVLTTNGTYIPDEPKVLIHMGIIDNGLGETNSLTDPFNNYDGNIGIELRGNSTMEHPKKSWNIELRDENNEDIDVSIMGMPAEEDWILKASWLDKTFMRDVIPFEQWQDLGYWAPRTKMCEVFVDGDYVGLYIMYEKIKRDNDRVDIAKLDADDTAGDSLTGGYIIGLGWDDGNSWDSNYETTTNEEFGFHVRYPKENNIQNEQYQYIQDYVHSFEDAVNSSTYTNTDGDHYSDIIDVKSFIHHFFINEISRNIDGLKQSTYLHKDKDSKGGKLMFSALWDYDVAYGNIDYCDSGVPTGWAYLYNSNCDGAWFQDVPTWWIQFMNDPDFVNQMNCEWFELRQNIFSLNTINNKIDSVAALIQDAQDRNFTEWPVMGDDLEAFPGPVPGSFQGEIDYLKDWFENRIAWLDINMPGTCNVGISEVESKGITIFPNPSHGELNVELSDADEIQIVSITGQVVFQKRLNKGLNFLDLSGISSGMYIVIPTASKPQTLIIKN